MCGIAGIYQRQPGPGAELITVLENMLEVMRHRGPDGRGSRDLGRLLLGHLRLAILDLSPRGAQPMSSADGQVVISYNGEVYNYLELRRELEAAGAAFRSRSDTEVILEAYRRWGLECFARLNGMWALAIWDAPRQRLVLCRDRLGIKPLYYSLDQRCLAFASEVKALAAYRRLRGLGLELNQQALQTYLQSGLVDGLEEGFFQGMQRFRAGHLMVVEEGRIRSYRPYWDLPALARQRREELAGLDKPRLVQGLRELLADAVEKHTRSDVPVGVCLSGGLDSSCVAALASRPVPGLQSFTAWFEEGDEYNELNYADQVVRRFGLESHRTPVDGGALLEKLPRLLWYLDEPTLAMGVYPQWHVMEAAARRVKVVMDGQGGDEVFAGYDFYAPRYLYGRLLARDFKGYQRTLAGFYRNYGLERVDRLGQEVKQLYLSNAARRLPRVFAGELDNLLYQELTRTRLPALLRYEDRLSMAFSIESRVPLLDHRLVELAFALDESLKLGPGWSKHIFRLALDDLLPPEITWRKDKKGFPTPFRLWADGVHARAIRELLLEPGARLGSLMKADSLRGFFAAWERGRRDEWLLWRLVSLELWLREYLPRLEAELARAGEGETLELGKPAGKAPRPQDSVEVIVTLDYETFDTDDFLLERRYRIDWQRDLIQPTERLARLLESVGARLTVLWDTAEYFWLVDHGHEQEAAAIRDQLCDLVRRGHDVQLHLHPAWCSVEKRGDRWLWRNPSLTAPTMPPRQFESLVERSVRTMREWFQPLRPGYRVRGFRARSYRVEPFKVIADTLKRHGIRADSSYHGQGPVPVRAPRLTQAVPPARADFLEYPIYRRGNERWDFSGPPQLVDLPLRVEGRRPPLGRSLVIIGHCKQPIHYEALQRCLAGLKERWGERLRFVTWQESIEARLSLLGGEWLEEGGFSGDYFERRWQEDDPFKSAALDDPYYQRLLELLPPAAGSLLDLGCAEGDFTALMARRLGAGRVLGVDISRRAVQRATGRHPELEFLCADLLKLRLDERFACIVASQNFYYFTSQERAVILANLEAMLAPEGVMLLAWWTGARRGYQEELIEEEFRRFFRVERQETYRAPQGAAVKGEHRILLGRRRLSLAEEAVLGKVHWPGKRVYCAAGSRGEDLKARFGWLCAQWLEDPAQARAAAPWDLVILERPDAAALELLKENGAVVLLDCPQPPQGIEWLHRRDGVCLGVRLGDAEAQAQGDCPQRAVA